MKFHRLEPIGDGRTWQLFASFILSEQGNIVLVPGRFIIGARCIATGKDMLDYKAYQLGGSEVVATFVEGKASSCISKNSGFFILPPYPKQVSIRIYEWTRV